MEPFGASSRAGLFGGVAAAPTTVKPGASVSPPTGGRPGFPGLGSPKQPTGLMKAPEKVPLKVEGDSNVVPPQPPTVKPTVSKAPGAVAKQDAVPAKKDPEWVDVVSPSVVPSAPVVQTVVDPELARQVSSMQASVKSLSDGVKAMQSQAQSEWDKRMQAQVQSIMAAFKKMEAEKAKSNTCDKCQVHEQKGQQVAMLVKQLEDGSNKDTEELRRRETECKELRQELETVRGNYKRMLQQTQEECRVTVQSMEETSRVELSDVKKKLHCAREEIEAFKVEVNMWKQREEERKARKAEKEKAHEDKHRRKREEERVKDGRHRRK